MEYRVREERRAYSRIPLSTPITFHYGSKQWISRLLDISLKGALIASPEGFYGVKEAPCGIEIPLDSSGTVISLHGRVVHCHQGHIGFHCERIDLDSITHLRRLLELHLGDASLVERELAELASGN